LAFSAFGDGVLVLGRLSRVEGIWLWGERLGSRDEMLWGLDESVDAKLWGLDESVDAKLWGLEESADVKLWGLGETLWGLVEKLWGLFNRFWNPAKGVGVGVPWGLAEVDGDGDEGGIMSKPSILIEYQA
jgi:hypothetical protein